MTESSRTTSEASDGPPPGVSPIVTQVAGAEDRLLDELDQPVRRRRLRSLLLAHKLLAAELNLPSLYRQVASIGGLLVDRPSSSVVVLDTDGDVHQLLDWSRSTGEPATVELEPEGIAQLSRIVSRLRPDLVRRLASSEQATPSPSSPWLPGDLLVPVTYRGTLLALLNVHREGGRAFSTADRDVLASFAVTAGIAIENARLYEDSRQRQLWLQHATALSTGLLGSAGEETALGLVVATVRQLADADHVALWMSSSQGSTSTASAAGWDGALPHPSLDDAMAREALEAGRGLRTTASAHPDSALALAAVGLGAGPVLAFTFGAEGGPSGLMVVLRHRGHSAFSGAELDRAVEFAAQLALAVEVLAARTLQQQLLLVSERERLATNLRDDVIQDLYAAGLKARSLVTGMDAGEPRSRLEDVVTILHDSVLRLRRSIFRLEQGGLDVDPTSERSVVRREGIEPPTR